MRRNQACSAASSGERIRRPRQRMKLKRQYLVRSTRSSPREDHRCMTARKICRGQMLRKECQPLLPRPKTHRTNFKRRVGARPHPLEMGLFGPPPIHEIPHRDGRRDPTAPHHRHWSVILRCGHQRTMVPGRADVDDRTPPKGDPRKAVIDDRRSRRSKFDLSLGMAPEMPVVSEHHRVMWGQVLPNRGQTPYGWSIDEWTSKVLALEHNKPHIQQSLHRPQGQQTSVMLTTGI